MKIALGQDYTTIVRNRNYGPKCMNESSVQADKVNKLISIWNKYFNFSLMQVYHVNEDCTTYNYNLNYKVPKWFHNKLKLISHKYSLQSAYDYDHIMFYEYDKNYLLFISVFNPYEYSVQLKTKREGLSFLSSYHMIEQKHRIMKPYKRFMNSFKNMDAAQIQSLIRQVSVDESIKLIGEHLSPINDSIFININNLV